MSVLNAFYWNNRYVFKTGENIERPILKALLKCILSYGITGLVLQNIFLYCLVEFVGVSKYLAPLLILVITIPLNYVLNKHWAFKTMVTKGLS